MGCGYGRNAIPLAKRHGRDVVACDISLNMCRSVTSAGIPFVLCDLRSLPFRNQCIDSIVCSVVLIHLRRREVGKAVSELKRVAKRVLLIMPNPLGPASLFGLKPLLFGLLMWLKQPATNRSSRRIFEDTPSPRGYIVNYYTPFHFQS